jgi:hypothetical protein
MSVERLRAFVFVEAQKCGNPPATLLLVAPRESEVAEGSVDSASPGSPQGTHPVRTRFAGGSRGRGSVPEDAGIPGNVHCVLLERGEGDDLERPFVGGGQHHVGGRTVLVGA